MHTWPRRLYPILIELWIALVLVVFFVVRIVGSNVGHRILTFIKHRLAQ
jgi:hypothetical protein